MMCAIGALLLQLLKFTVTNSRKTKKVRADHGWSALERKVIVMFWEYLLDMSFVIISLIGGIVALLFVFIRRSNRRRAR
jgi:lysophospholipid acyltransferase (LPLAT)-like uncharacterized protein